MIKNNKINCHPEALAEGSHKILHCVQNDVMTQQGRSMVEMLGVLAVIGVLSVAGIAGYSMAMRNHRANEVLNAASMLYVMAMAKNQGTGADSNYTELGTAPSGTTLAYTASDKKITITFTNEEDCTAAKNKLGDKASGNCSEKTLTVTLGEVNGDVSPSLPSELDCFVAGTCATSEDCEASGLTMMYDGKCSVATYVYCMRDKDELPAADFAEMWPEGCGDADAQKTEFINKYSQCLKTHSALYCNILMYGNTPEDSSAVESCVSSGKSRSCCACIHLPPYYDEADCIEGGDCP